MSNELKTTLIALGVSVVVLLGGLALVGGNQSADSGEGAAAGLQERLGVVLASVNWFQGGIGWFNQGLYVGDEQEFFINSDGDITAATLDVTGAMSLSGLVTLNGGQLRSKTNSTSTVLTSQTLVVSDLAAYDTVSIVPNTGATTLTFFASSTASAWLPAAGDMQETCIYNATSSAVGTIIFAAGTGIDLETASSTPSDLTLVAGNTACFKFIRQPATAAKFDISALMTEYSNGD